MGIEHIILQDILRRNTGNVGRNTYFQKEKSLLRKIITVSHTPTEDKPKSYVEYRNKPRHKRTTADTP